MLLLNITRICMPPFPLPSRTLALISLALSKGWSKNRYLYKIIFKYSFAVPMTSSRSIHCHRHIIVSVCLPLQSMLLNDPSYLYSYISYQYKDWGEWVIVGTLILLQSCKSQHPIIQSECAFFLILIHRVPDFPIAYLLVLQGFPVAAWGKHAL